MKRTLASILVVGGMMALALGEEAPRVEGSPYTKKNNSWITISGKVTSTTPDDFILDYGKGAVLVEMDDWDWYKEGHAVLVGDVVTVDGRVDRDKGEKTSIEANSVFVKGLRTHFYASPEDEEDTPRFYNQSPESGQVVRQGTVTKINGREFTLTNEFFSIVIDTKALDYNPMDEKGYQQIQVGDVVRVSGVVDEGVFETDEIHPTSIVTLRKF